MVDIAIKDQLKTYWNGALAGTPNALYDEIVNFDVVKNPYKIRKDKGSFFLRKRKGFKQSFAGISGTCVDIQDLYDMDCDGGEGYRYYYYVNGTTHTIYKRLIGSCSAPTTVDSWTACDCQFQGFIKTDFVKGPKRRLFDATATTDTTTGTIVNDSSTYINGGIYDTGNTWNYEGATSGIEKGDFIWFYHNGGSSNSIPGQVKRVTGHNAVGYSGNSTLTTSSPWSMVGTSLPNTDTDVRAAIFPSWGDVLLYVGKDEGYMGASNSPAVKIIHSPHSINPTTGVQNNTDTITIIGPTIGESGRCPSSIIEHQNTVLIHHSNGYTLFGGSDFNKFYYSLESQFKFGKEITRIASYRNFVLGFGQDRVYSATYNGTDYDRDILRDNLGIRSPEAYALFDNSFYFVASDKRLYAVDIKRDGNQYILDLSDQSGPMLGHLENIKDGDAVYMLVDRDELKVFHTLSGNTYPEIKTKILTYNKDYALFHWWETGFTVRGVNKDEYYGSAVWFNCGDQDGSDYFTAKVNAYIGDNTQNGTDISIFQKSALTWGKLLLGNGIYNDGYTYVNVYSWRNGWRTIARLGKIEDIEWTQKYGEFVIEGTVADTSCLSTDEEIYAGPNDGVEYATVDDTRCGPSGTYSCPDYIDDNVEGIKIKSELDKVSEIGVLHIPITTQPSDLIKVEVVSKGLDILNFGGMLREVQKFPLDDRNTIGDFVLKDDNCNLSYT